METIKTINSIIGVLFMLCYAYQFFYIAVSFLKKSKPHKTDKLHNFAVLIAARNEQSVIENLIQSIKTQDYPEKLVSVFVVADNCTDSTAKIARRAGATVYERFNKNEVGKGYALDFLTSKIKEDYGDVFDAFFVFDADNVLDKNYITEMNKTFSNGYKIVTSYRNSKNYGANWISAGYALWFLRESKYLNNARMLLGTSCAVSGTGFMFSREIIEKTGGWKFFLLTEDIEFTIYNVTDGEKIGYCASACLYDEQPECFSQSWNQRMRWAKGYLQVFAKYGTKLLKGIFSKKAFSCFDMTMCIMPAVVLTIVAGIINVTATVLGIVTQNTAVLIAVLSLAETVLKSYLLLWIVGTITTVTEWKNIHTSIPKKVLYTFTFPLFMFTYIPISFIAFFKKVKWTSIEHKHSMNLEQIKENS